MARVSNKLLPHGVSNKATIRLLVALLSLLGCTLIFLLSNTALANRASDSNTILLEQSHKVYLSDADEHGFPKKDKKEVFECTEKIYSVLELSDYPVGTYQLSVAWIDPALDVRERTEYEFRVRESETRLWAWLTLSRATGASLLQWINPAAGLEEFVGGWKIEVSVNDQKLASSDFQVVC